MLIQELLTLTKRPKNLAWYRDLNTMCDLHDYYDNERMLDKRSLGYIFCYSKRWNDKDKIVKIYE